MVFQNLAQNLIKDKQMTICTLCLEVFKFKHSKTLACPLSLDAFKSIVNTENIAEQN